MKRAILAAFVSCAISLTSFSQEIKVNSTPSSSTYSTLANALLWQIDHVDWAQPSYLYGTIHIIGQEDYFLLDEVKTAFDSSTQVAFEIDMEDMMDLSSQLSLMMGAFMNDNVTLKDLMSAEEYNFVKSAFEDKGLPMFLLERIKPMFLTILASVDLESGLGGNAGDQGSKSYEMEFMEMAKARELEVLGLETAAYQMSLFDSIPYKEQAQMLVESLKAEEAAVNEMDIMVELYKSQDINAMVTMVGEDDEMLGKYQDILLDQRNRNWIPKISLFGANTTTFFAVGAGHLAGPSGVIHLLREAGYTLTPLSLVPSKQSDKSSAPNQNK